MATRPHKVTAKSLANLKPGGGGRRGIPNRATRDLKKILDNRFYRHEAYWRNLEARIKRGTANAQEVYLLSFRFGRPRAIEDDLPIQQVGDAGPQIVINLPRPPGELAGRTVVTGAIRVETES